MSNELIENLNENYSLFNGKYLETLWIIYDFYLKNNSLLIEKTNLMTIDNLTNLMLVRYEESLDLVSAQALCSLIRSSKNFVHLIKLVNNEVNK